MDQIISQRVLPGLLRGADERIKTVLDKMGVTPQAIRDAVDALSRKT